ncbi:hypothetical protein E8E95_14730 [Pseudomonas sp. BN414]|nr:hypothetical protein [Pseudomonas sp. BN414]
MNLFDLVVEDADLHPLFRRVVQEENYKAAMAVINEWSLGLLDRRSEAAKFIKEFQTTFNSSLWEIYLNKAFREFGFEIDYAKSAPDFNLKHHSGKFVSVEAVTTNNRLNRDEDYYSFESFNDQINDSNHLDRSTIKLIGKLKDKRDLFTGTGGKKYPYSSLEHVKGNPFVVAIAPFDNHLSYAQNNMAINRVLYGIDPPVADSDGVMIAPKIGFIENHNNQKIELGIFTNESYKEISAVIFSTTGMFGKAVSEAGVSNLVRATRYRKMDILEFMNKEGAAMLGYTHRRISERYDIYSLRLVDGGLVCGSDTFFYDSKFHRETHLDGLHIYYNPYAEVPLDKNLFSAYEVTQNSYNIETGSMICQHNDGSLVSRQTFTSLSSYV